MPSKIPLILLALLAAHPALAQLDDNGVNVKFFGATGNTRQVKISVSCAAGSNALTLAPAVLTNADAGKSFEINLPAAGGLVAAGQIASAAPGSLTASTACVQTVSNQQAMLFFGHDDSAGLAAAITYATAHAATDGNAPVYLPPGTYYLDQTPLPVISRVPVGIAGASEAATTLIISPSFPGTPYGGQFALFGWSGLTNIGVGNRAATTNVAVSQGETTIGRFSLIGNRQASHPITALAFLDYDKGMRVQDVNVQFWPGTVVQTGSIYTPGNPFGYLTESVFSGVHTWQSGAPGLPVFDFNDTGHGDSDNSIVLNDIDLFYPYGDGIVLRSDTTVNPERGFLGDAIRIENVQPGQNGIRVGDPTEDGGTGGANIYDVQFSHLAIAVTQPGGTGILIEARPDAHARRNVSLTFQGLFTNNKPGMTCINVTNGDQIRFDFDTLGGPVNVVNNHGTVLFTGLGIGYHSTITHFQHTTVEWPAYIKRKF